MFSSPYPAPPLRLWQTSMIIGWVAGIGAGAWVLISPPASYVGLANALTTAWGLMLAVGCGLAAIGHALQKYKLELPGLTLALGGIVIYSYLSWQQTFTTSPGSGPRALVLVAVACWITARIRVLIYLDRQARRLIEMREPTV